MDSDLSGQCFVVKYGGAAMDDPRRVEAALREIVGLAQAGVRVVLVHGGGKAITRALEKEGVATRFIDGLRVTDAASIAAIARTLDGEVGPGIAQALAGLGAKAVALSGREVLRARPIAHARAAELGFVGEVEAVVFPAVEPGVIPVISPLGSGTDGALYNINADTAAAAVAVALRADRLVFLTDVNGVLRDSTDPASTLPTLDPTSIEKLQAEGVISGGMIPKVGGALDALRRGVGRVDFLNGAAGFSFFQPCGTTIHL